MFLKKELEFKKLNIGFLEPYKVKTRTEIN